MTSKLRFPRQLRLEHIRYLLRKVGLLTVGAAYVSAPVSGARRARDRATLRPTTPLRVAVVAHIFYTDCTHEILDCFETLPSTADLVLTAPSDRADVVRGQLEGMDRARLIVLPNRGRDIAPFLSVLAGGELDRYDVVLKLHTKRSPHLIDGDIRRRLLFTMLAGTRRKTARILDVFTDEQTALVGWRPSWRTEIDYWMGDRKRVLDLARRMDIAVADAPCFFEGSMFWVRPAALRRLRELGLSLDDFETGNDATDGQLHHAIERIFALVVVSDGFTVRDDGGRLLLGAIQKKEARAER